MRLISSYPRSGSAKLKFLICNILHPDVEHNFNTVNHYIPSIDSAEHLNNCADKIRFICTHSDIRSDIYLYRHVGDVLISEYWYKKKYYGTTLNLENWIIETNFGESWRRSIEAGRGAEKRIAFEQLGDPEILSTVLQYPTEFIRNALEKCSFEQMRKIEKTSNLGGNEIPYMRSGQSHQWLQLACWKDIMRANEGELAYLGYWKPDDWEGRDVKINEYVN